jgi:hypothetical protein
MNSKKYGLILVIMASMLVAVSSGFTGSGWGWSSTPSELSPSNLSPFGYVEPYNLSEWINFDWKPMNLSEWLYPEPAQPDTEDDPLSSWEPVPLVMPETQPLSKQELFGSLTTVSANKQSLISSYKTGSYFG